MKFLIRRVKNMAKLVLAALSCYAFGVIFASHAVGDVGPAPANMLPLVQADSSLADWLERAEKCIAEDDFGQAITILQALIEKPDGGFVAVLGSKSHYVSLRSEAARLLGEIPQAGLDGYRRLYDVKAKQKLDDALAAGDLPALAELAQIFQYTSHGLAILKNLAAVQFDRSQFLQAARTWQILHNANLKRNGFAAIYAVAADEKEAALLLTKIAIAFHLAGQDNDAATYAERLRDDFPKARAVLGGKDQKLVAFVAEVLAKPVKLLAETPDSTKKKYPGWGGLPAGQVIMDDCDVILLPRWQYPKPAADEPNVFPHLSTKSMLASMSTNNPNNKKLKFSARLRDGRIYTGRVSRRSKSGLYGGPLPPMLRPVIFGDTVIYRDDQRVQAIDMFTGKLRWKSPALPLLRQPEQQDNEQQYFYNAGGMVIDRGQFGLTIGGEKIFTIHSFLPPNLIFRPAIWGARQPIEKEQAETPKGSALSAVSLKSGKELWTVGLGKGDEFLKTCIFISLPTYIPTGGGQLYMTALVNDNYYVLCLQAQTGKLIWKAQVSQTPPTRNYFGPGLAGLVKMIATPPAVVGDSVFVCTNAGVLAAFDAASGQPKWAFQYPSSLAGRKFWLGMLRGSRSISKDNPLIITDGLVIAMPIDAINVFALRADNGKVVWEEPRDGLDHLAFVDNGRVVLGSGKIHVLNTKTGKAIFKSGDIGGRERPLVTKNNIMLAGKNNIVRISLRDYAIATTTPVHGGGLLGNFVSVAPALIAANPLGVCAYFSYEDGYDLLSKRLTGKNSLTRAKLLLQRAKLSFSAGKYEKTSDDLANCQLTLNNTEANTDNSDKIQKDLDRWLYLTELAKGNSTTGPDKQKIMMAHFQKALALAPRPREKAHTLLRLAKCCEKFGDMTQAVDWAQKLSHEFPGLVMLDVEIGPAAIDPAGNLPKALTEPARQHSKKFIERLIKIHGSEIYARFDAKAKTELDNAILTGDPAALETVAKRWPISQAATEAIFLAGEAYYRKAAQQTGNEAEESLAKATALLCAVASKAKHPRCVSAKTALVAVYTVAGWTQAAEITRKELKDIPLETPVAFADIQGQLGEVLTRIDSDKIIVPIYSNEAATARKLTTYIKPPLREIFHLPGARILTDQEYKPVRIGQMVLVQQGNKTIMLDTAADTAKQASRNFILAKLNNQGISKGKLLIPGMTMIAGRSKDGSIIVLCSKSLMTAYRVDTGKILWSHVPETFGLLWLEVMGLGDDTLVVGNFRGKIAAVDFADGKIKWKTKIELQPTEDDEAKQRTKRRRNRARQGWRAVANETSPPLVGGGLAVFSHYSTGSYNLTVLDLASGRPLDTFTGRQSAQAFMTSTGLLATMVDGELAIHNRKSFDTKRPICEIAYQASLKPRIIGVSNQYIAVAPSPSAKTIQTVELVSLHSFGAAQNIELKLETKKKMALVSALFDGPSVYLTYASGSYGSKSMPSLRPRMVRRPALAKFDTSTGKPLWTRDLITKKPLARWQLIIAPPAFGRSYLVWQIRAIRLASRCDVIDKSTGEIVQAIIKNKTVKPGKGSKISQQVNVSVITSGRLTVETEQGVTVHGE